MSLRARQNGGGKVRNGGGRGAGNGSPEGRGNSGGGGGGDPYFAQVQLLSHFDGTNGSQVYIDASNAARTLTPAGGSPPSSTGLSTGIKLYGTASVGMAGNGSISVADAPSLEPGSGDFTFEIAFYANASGSTEWFIDKRAAGGTGYAPFLIGRSSTTLYFFASVDGASWILSSSTTTAFSTGVWNTVAMSRVGSTLYCFLNGTLITSANLGVSALYNNSNPWSIGAASTDGASGFSGNIDEVRYTVGTGRYSATYTPATSAFPNS